MKKGIITITATLALLTASDSATAQTATEAHLTQTTTTTATEAHMTQAAATRWERMKARQHTGVFHWELEGRHDTPLGKRSSDKYGHRSTPRRYISDGWAIQTAFLFNLKTKQGVSPWTVGAGIGFHRIDGRNSLPVNLTLRYRPLAKQLPSLFAYTDLGYSLLGKSTIYDDPERGDYRSIGTGKSYDMGETFNGYGPFGGLGIGYQHMCSRRFGLSVKLGYHLQQFRRTISSHISAVPIEESSDDGNASGYYWVEDDINYGKQLLHSLQLSFGLVF